MMTTGKAPDLFMPCMLLSGEHDCSVEAAGNLCRCSTCGTTCAPIRMPHEAEKALKLPEKLRRLLVALMTSNDDSQSPFFLMFVSSAHFDRLPGIGRTRLDHPGEISLDSLQGTPANITIRWGELCPNYGHAEPVAAADANPEVAALPVYQRLSAIFTEAGLEFRAPVALGRHLFVGTFKLPEHADREVGISVLVSID